MKYDDLLIALSYVHTDFIMLQLDITSAYHFMSIYRPHTEFWEFSLVDKSGVTNFYKFIVLPFGFSKLRGGEQRDLGFLDGDFG